MQETSLQPPQPQALSLGEFLAALIQSFGREGLRPCILRNYEGFPAANLGNDVDFLIRPSELPSVIRAIKSISDIRIVGYAERYYVAHVFVEGVCAATGSRALQLDFLWRLDWKGQSYLAPDDVLHAAIPRQAGNLAFWVPSPVHEAIISLLSSLLIGGWLKEKYFPKVQQTFTRDTSEVTAALVPGFGRKVSTRLVNSVIGGDRKKTLGCVRHLRISLATRSLRRRPLGSVSAAAKHYAREFALRYSAKALTTVVVTGIDYDDKTAIVDGLISMLRHSATAVERRNLEPLLSSPRQLTKNAGAGFEDRAGPALSMTTMALWVIKEWASRFKKKNTLTLRICDNCLFNFIDTKKHRGGIPMWFARRIENLLPCVDLWLFLDGTEAVMKPQHRDLADIGTLRQTEAFRTFVKTGGRYVMLNVSRPNSSIRDEAYAAIVATLAQRTDGKLKKRF